MNSWGPSEFYIIHCNLCSLPAPDSNVSYCCHVALFNH